MHNYKHFIRWKLAGGTKLPLSPTTGEVVDAHDVRHHCGFAEALVSPHGDGVAIVLVEGEGYFFLDIDHALTAAGWSQTAVELCRYFKGCYQETSQSGSGKHVFGKATPAFIHATRNGAFGLELYTKGRFCALTGYAAEGSIHYPAQEQFDWLVKNYFPPRMPATAPEEWTNGPVAEYTGPSDDTKLVERLLSQKSNPFSSGASPKALWCADGDALSAAYPDAARGWDWSAADMALCQHLAFWTGKDCERMDRLFRVSALCREKWLEREDYRRETILKAVGNCRKVYSRVPEAPIQGMREGLQYFSIQQQVTLFDGCIYVQDRHEVLIPDGGMIGPEQFKVTYGGRVFALDTIGGKSTTNAWLAFTQSQGYSFPKVHGVCFRPELPPREIVIEEGRTLVNTWFPIETPQKQGDIRPFLDLLERMLPQQRDREILLAYCAAMIQHPGEKIMWCPLIQGVEGNGKSIFVGCIEYAVGKRYTHFPNPEDISNKFNPWIEGKLFVGIEEVFTQDRNSIINTLKRLITNRRIEVQGKGKDQKTGDNRANFIMTTNHKDAVRKTPKDRRYCIFYTAQQTLEDIERSGMGGKYFSRLIDWLNCEGYAIINHFLRSYKVPPDLDPFGDCHRAPATSSTAEVLQCSLGAVEQLLLDCVAEGKPGFAGNWVSSKAFDRLCEDHRKYLSGVRKAECLIDLGYVKHPAFKEGRVNNYINDCGFNERPVLWARRGSIQLNVTVGKEAVRMYQEAQKLDQGDGFTARQGGSK
jgi:hypothetical protein